MSETDRRQKQRTKTDGQKQTEYRERHTEDRDRQTKDRDRQTDVRDRQTERNTQRDPCPLLFPPPPHFFEPVIITHASIC